MTIICGFACCTYRFQESLAAGRRHQQDRSPTEEFAVCTRHHQGRSGSVVASDDSSLFSENAPQGSNDDASRNVPNKKGEHLDMLNVVLLSSEG